MFALNVRPAFHGHTQRWNIDEDHSNRTQSPELSDDLAQKTHMTQHTILPLYGFSWILGFSRRRSPASYTTGDEKTLGLPKKLLPTWEPRWPRPTSCPQPLSSEYSWTTLPSPHCPMWWPVWDENNLSPTNQLGDRRCWFQRLYWLLLIFHVCTDMHTYWIFAQIKLSLCWEWSEVY